MVRGQDRGGGHVGGGGEVGVDRGDGAAVERARGLLAVVEGREADVDVRE